MRDKYLSREPQPSPACPAACSQALIWLLIGFRLEICMFITARPALWGPGRRPRAPRQMPGGGGEEDSALGGRQHPHSYQDRSPRPGAGSPPPRCPAVLREAWPGPHTGPRGHADGALLPTSPGHRSPPPRPGDRPFSPWATTPRHREWRHRGPPAQAWRLFYLFVGSRGSQEERPLPDLVPSVLSSGRPLGK